MKQFVMLTLLASLGMAQEAAPLPSEPSVRATGEATVSVRPDQARVDIGVVTQTATAQEAATQNARQVDQVIAQLRKALPAGTEIQTVGYSLHPVYRHARDAAPTIQAYSATNTVRVTLTDLTAVGRAIDVGTRQGANVVQNVQFSLRDEQAARSKALQEAARQARANAEAMAAALNLRVVRVLHLSEGSPAVVRPLAVAMERAAAVATPIEPGTVDVRAVVNIVVQVAP